MEDKRKPFNAEEFISNEKTPVETRDGIKVEILSTTRKSNCFAVVGDYVKVKSSDKVYLIKQIKETGVLVSDIINSSNDFEFPIDKSIISEKVTKFDPKWLKPFDRVVAFDQIHKMWIATLFSHITEEDETTYPYITCDADSYDKCIPFNAETKHLVGTYEQEPEFYRI